MTDIDTVLLVGVLVVVLVAALHVYAWWAIRNLPREPVPVRDYPPRRGAK
jgi:hypothetical protein